jgi:uncharacterized protein YdeI (BOF family)
MNINTRLKMLAIGGILSLGTLACSADMTQNPSASADGGLLGRQDNVAAGESTFPDAQKTMQDRVQGELVKIDGDTYTVKDSTTGKETSFYIDKNSTQLDKDRTRLEGNFKTGDRIEARVAPDGHALYVQPMPDRLAEGKTASSDDLARQNLEAQRRLQPKSRDDRATMYAPEFTPEIGGQKQGGPADFPRPAFPLVVGELMSMEGQFYTLQDSEGKQIRLHIDRTTLSDCGSTGESKDKCSFAIGDWIEARRISPTDDHAASIRKLSASEMAARPGISPVGAGTGDRMKDELVTLGGAKQSLRGEVVKVEGDQYVIKDHHGSEYRVVINQNTRMWCGSEAGSFSGLLPDPSASDKPGAKGPQDLSGTNEQKGSDVGPGTKSSTAKGADCVFKAGDTVEAEVSDMGAATFIKMAGRAQPGQPLP